MFNKRKYRWFLYWRGDKIKESYKCRMFEKTSRNWIISLKIVNTKIIGYLNDTLFIFCYISLLINYKMDHEMNAYLSIAIELIFIILFKNKCL
jgi:hypothetical protein